MGTSTERGWSLRDMPDLTDRTAVVTGASSGLGRTVAKALAARGARVVLAVRDPRHSEQMHGSHTEKRQLDLADLVSVKEFAEALCRDVDSVDLLINNAGVGLAGAPRTRQGFEGVLGTNHLGHFALTGMLLPLLEAAENARVLTVTSVNASYADLDLDRLADDLGPTAAYNRSKLANTLFARELDRRLRASGSTTRSVLAHPGMARTPIHRRMESVSVRLVFRVLEALIGRPVEEAALPLLYAATGPQPAPDVMIGPGRSYLTWMAPVRPTAEALAGSAMDDALARGLWNKSATLTGVAYPTLAEADD